MAKIPKLGRVKPKRDVLRALEALPRKQCEHCGHEEIAPCSPRAWRQAERCPSFKAAEFEFYRRIGNGPVASTSPTRRSKTPPEGGWSMHPKAVAARRQRYFKYSGPPGGTGLVYDRSKRRWVVPGQ
jgi:hypothetical protein